MILWKLSLREIRSHRGRAILTAVSIVIGVAAVVAVNLASDAVRASFGAVQATIAGEASLEVAPAGDNLLDESLAEQLVDIPGVKVTSPIYQRPTVMYAGEDQRVSVTLVGVDPSRDEAARDYGLVAGRKISQGDEVLLDAAFAAGLKIEVGDRIRLLTSYGRREFKVVGSLKPLTGAAVGRGSVLFLPLKTAQARFKARGRVSQVQLILEEGANAKAVAAEVAQRLPPGLTVRASASPDQMGEETMLALQMALRLATAFALVAAVFIVGNAFFMNVTQRERQLAVMRAIGATRWQVWRLILQEAVLLAVLGTAAGIAAGWGGAVLMSAAMERLFNTDLPAPLLNGWVATWACVFGLGVSFLGAVLPARRAAKVEPIEGMQQVSRGDVEGMPRWFVIAGATGFVISGVWLLASVLGYAPAEEEIVARVGAALEGSGLLSPEAIELGAWAAGKLVIDSTLMAILFLIFAVPVLPLVLDPLSGAAAFGACVLGRPVARIARQQLLRRRVRTTLTIGVLFVASSTGMGLASTVLDNIHDIQEWYRKIMAGDFFVRAMTPDLATWTSAQIPDEAEQEAKTVPGIDTVFGVRFVTAEVRVPGQSEWQQVLLTARDFPSANTVQSEMLTLSPEEMRTRLERGEVTIGSVLSQRTGLKLGDEIEIQTAEGPRRRSIAGIINDYIGVGLVVHMDRSVAARDLGVQGVDAVVVRALPGRKEEVESSLRAVAEKYGLLFQSYRDLTAEIDTMLVGVIGGLWVVMILGLVVASLGVMNTLTMNVLEQTRELAMLRVVAMTRRQARRTVLAQAAILGGIGVIPGITLGLGLSWLMNRSLVRDIGHEVTFGFHPWLGVIGAAVAMVLVVLAASLPAQRAANLEPIQALRYD